MSRASFALIENCVPVDKPAVSGMMVAIHDGVEQQWTRAGRNVLLKRTARMTKPVLELYVKDRRRVHAR
jgi:hypothetical protein